MLRDKLYVLLAGACAARLRCKEKNNSGWFDKWEESIETLVRKHMPSGSGVDSGVKFNFDKSTGEKLVFDSGFHAMDENGFYERWINFSVTVKPSLQFGFTLNIVGNFGRRQEIKEYLHGVFSDSLGEVVSEEV